MKNLFAILVLISAPTAFAATESPAKLRAEVLRACEAYAKKSIAEDYKSSRGGTCTGTKLVLDGATPKRGFVAPLSASREIPVIEAYGILTVECSSALFFAAETFQVNVRLLAGPFYNGCSAIPQGY